MVLNVSSLLKTVKAVEDEHTRGTRAMEATVEAISQEIRVNFLPFLFQYFGIEICCTKKKITHFFLQFKYI